MVLGSLETVEDEKEYEASRETLPGGDRIYRVRLHIKDVYGPRMSPEHGWTPPSRVWRDMDASDVMG